MGSLVLRSRRPFADRLNEGDQLLREVDGLAGVVKEYGLLRIWGEDTILALE